MRRAASIGAVLLDKKDNVGTALRPLRSDKLVRLSVGKGMTSIAPIEHIPTGHKVALIDIRRGECVIKYGEAIGEASAFIPKGSHVHVHNLRSRGGLNR